MISHLRLLFFICAAWLIAGLNSPAAEVSVILPDGSPAAGATAVSVAKVMFLHVKNGAIIKHYGDAPPLLPDDGRIVIPDKEIGRWVFLHPKGWADLAISLETREVRLQPWNEIQGTLEESARPKAPASVAFSRIESRPSAYERGSVYWTSEAAVADDGGFVIANLPTGAGVVGLLREIKNGRREQRWKDFPVEISVPHDGQIRIGGSGVEVRGRLSKNTGALALVTIIDRSGGKTPPHFGATNDDGAFAIPGIAPGNYRIVIRPFDEGKFHVQREFVVRKEDSSVNLGEFADTSPDVEIYRQVEFPDGLIDRVREVASKQCDRPIKKIWLGQLFHPGNVWGARVTFEPEPTDETHATARMFVVQIPGETIRKFYPEHDTDGFGYRFIEGDFFAPRLFEETVRIFPLATQTLHLKIEEPLDYDTALALLKAIEARTWKTKEKPRAKTKNKDGSWTVSFSGSWNEITADDLPKVDSIRREKIDGPIKLHTRERDFGGKAADFEFQNGEFILLGVGHWVS
ncbi:MAG: carboxypeptidase-like regulatory domain-containing protein [Verrucomicrobiae bacterium]